MTTRILKHIPALIAAIAGLGICGPATAQIDYFSGQIFVGRRPLSRPLVSPITQFQYAVPNGEVAYLGDGSDAIIPPDPRLLAAADRAPGNAIPRMSESIDARMDKDGKLQIKWQGEPRIVDHIAFALLDKDRKVIKEQAITRLPAETRFTLTNKTSYYRVTVTYLNGTTTAVVSPI